MSAPRRFARTAGAGLTLALLLSGCGGSAGETEAGGNAAAQNTENAVVQDGNDAAMSGRDAANVADPDNATMPASTPTPRSPPPVDDLLPATGNVSTPGNKQQAADLTANPQAGKTITARFRCIDGSSLAVRFDKQAGTATLSRGGKQIAALETRHPASGIYYRSGDYVLRGKGREIAWSTPDTPPLSCTEIGG